MKGKGITINVKANKIDELERVIGRKIAKCNIHLGSGGTARGEGGFVTKDERGICIVSKHGKRFYDNYISDMKVFVTRRFYT